MRIQSKITCWTPYPEMNWPAGVEKEVSEEVGEKLLRNKNFVKVSETKSETESEKEENVKYRKKRSIRNRA